MALLEVESLSKSYRVGTSQLSVLRGLDLSVETGEMVAIVGASGVGQEHADARRRGARPY